MIKKNWIRSLCMVVVLSTFLLMAMGSGSSGSSKTKDVVDATKATTITSKADETTTAEVTTTQGAAELGKPITIGDYEVTVQKVVISKDYDGKDAITIVYDWTNNSEKTVSPMFAVSFSVFQDGKELESAIILDDESADSLAEVRPAISVEGLSRSFITTSKNELEIEVGELISLGEPVLLKVPFPQG